LRRGEVLDGCVLVVCTTQIHVSCRSTRRVEAEVECEGTFQDPAAGRDGDESAEEEFEGDALAEAGDAEPGLHRLGLEAVIESLTERCRAHSTRLSPMFSGKCSSASPKAQRGNRMRRGRQRHLGRLLMFSGTGSKTSEAATPKSCWTSSSDNSLI